MSEYKDKIAGLQAAIERDNFSIPETDEQPALPDNMVSGDHDSLGIDSDENHGQTEQKEEKKRSRQKKNDRVRILAQEKAAILEENIMMRQRIQQQEHMWAAAQEQLKQNEGYRDAYYEDNLHTKEVAILRELRQAKEDGDIDKEVALSNDLASVKADQSTHKLYKHQMKQTPVQEYVHPYENYQAQRQVQPSVNEHYEDWLEENQWADPRSDNFSQRLRNKAEEIANEFEDMLRLQNKSHMIGTQQYYEAISNALGDNYSLGSKRRGEEDEEDEYEDHSPQQMQEMRSYSPQSSSVAPVMRSGGSMADQYSARNPSKSREYINLRNDSQINEIDFARNCSGAFLMPGEDPVSIYKQAKINNMKKTKGRGI